MMVSCIIRDDRTLSIESSGLKIVAVRFGFTFVPVASYHRASFWQGCCVDMEEERGGGLEDGGVESVSDDGTVGQGRSGKGRKDLERWSFLGFVALMTALFLWMLKPFFGAILGLRPDCDVLSLQRRMLGWMRGRQNLAALATLGVMCSIVVVPAVFLSSRSSIRDGSLQISSANGWAPAEMFEKVASLLPPVAAGWLKDSGFATLDQTLKQLPDIAGLLAGGVASRAWGVVQGSLGFLLNLALMLYLVFVMLVSGPSLVEKLVRALPLGDARERLVIAKFGEVVRATLKGSVVVAAVQGALGGLIFLILGAPHPLFWGVVMAVLSLIPVVGSGVVWAPYAVFLIATGHLVKGIVLIVFGVVVIGLADNILRPILVGRETRMPISWSCFRPSAAWPSSGSTDLCSARLWRHSSWPSGTF